jgi:hypothetical protein
MHLYAHRHRLGRSHFFDADEWRRHRVRGHLVVGGGLVALGLAWLLRSWGVIGAEGLWLAVPAVLAWSGIVRIALDRRAASVVRALLRFALAAYLVLVIEQVGGLTWAATWPVLAIGAGIAMVAGALFTRAHGDRNERSDEEAAW